MLTLDSEEQLARAVAELGAVEPRFLQVFDKHGLPPLRRALEGLPGLLRIVTDQMISRHAAQAIWQRVELHVTPFTAEAITRMAPSDLKSLGLSTAKARTFLGVAKAVALEAFDFAELQSLPDGEAKAALTALPGIGPWTAEIYLLTALGRSNAWPSGDLALQASAQDLFALESRPDARAMDRLAEAWQPWRAVAARLLWSHYRGLRGWPQALS